MKENHRERNFTIIMAITMVFSGLLGFLGSIDPPFSRWKGFTIYIGSVCSIRPQSSTQFEHLIASQGRFRAKHPGLNWISESSSLSGSLHLVVDMVDLFRSCNCRIQVGI